MESEKFDLIFSGQLVAGFELPTVKKNIQMLFRIDAGKVELLFSGKDIPLKKQLDAEAANKYRVAMKKAGALVNVVQSNAVASDAASNSVKQSAGSATTAQPPVKVTEQPVPPTLSATQTTSRESLQGVAPAVLSTALGAQPPAEIKPREVIQAPDFGLAEVGADLILAEEKPAAIKVTVDVSNLSIAAQAGPLVNPSELSRPQPVTVNVPDVAVAPVGSDLLRPQERKVVAAVAVDTSSLSVAAVGERLTQPGKAPPPAPNVDHIKLAE